MVIIMAAAAAMIPPATVVVVATMADPPKLLLLLLHPKQTQQHRTPIWQLDFNNSKSSTTYTPPPRGQPPRMKRDNRKSTYLWTVSIIRIIRKKLAFAPSGLLNHLKYCIEMIARLSRRLLHEKEYIRAQPVSALLLLLRSTLLPGQRDTCHVRGKEVRIYDSVTCYNRC